jgi:hypothetical protein
MRPQSVGSRACRADRHARRRLAVDENAIHEIPVPASTPSSVLKFHEKVRAPGCGDFSSVNTFTSVCRGSKIVIVSCLAF